MVVLTLFENCDAPISLGAFFRFDFAPDILVDDFISIVPISI